VSGLAEEMADLLEDKVYVGVSAGSMIFSRNLSERTGEAFGEQDDLGILGETAGTFTIRAFRLVPQAASELAQLFPTGLLLGSKRPPRSSIARSTPSMTTRPSAFAATRSTSSLTASGCC